MVYGADTQALGPYVLSVLRLQLPDVRPLLAGAVEGPLHGQDRRGRRPRSSRRLNKWASLPKHGCTNTDVLTKTNILGAFVKGQAAMIVDGNWDTATLQKGLGTKLAAFVPPYSDSQAEGRRPVPGRRLLGLKLLEAPARRPSQFLKFMMTAAGREDHLGGGPDPRRHGLHGPTNPLSNQMLASPRSRASRPIRCSTT